MKKFFLLFIIFSTIACAQLHKPPFSTNQFNLIKSIVRDSTQALRAATKIVSDSLADDITYLAPKVSPTFTGTVILPSTTSIGNVSSAEIGYLDGATSAVQTQIDALPTVIETKSLISDSVAKKLDSDFSSLPLLPSNYQSNDANRIPIQKEDAGAGDINYVEVANLPVSVPVNDVIQTQNINNTNTYATKTQLDNAYTLINSQSDLISQLSYELDSLKIVVAAGINPFPTKPTNLAGTGYETSIRITWTNSTDIFDSTAIYFKTINAVSYTNVYQKKDSTGYTIVGLTSSTGYYIYIRHRAGNIFSESTPIITVVTSASTWIPNLAGVFDGSTLFGFDYIITEGNNTLTVSNGKIVAYYDSTFATHESAYVQKNFVAHDSVYLEATVNIPSTIKTFAIGDDFHIMSIIDTAANVFGIEFGVQDASGSDKIPDVWYIRYKNITSNIEATSPIAFVLGTDTRFRIARLDDNLTGGKIQIWAGDSLIFNLSGKNLNSYSMGGIRIGNDNLNANDVAVFTTITFDNIYVDSRGFGEIVGSSGGGSIMPLSAYYIDYAGGDDTNDGLTEATAFKHCVGDPLATGVPATLNLTAGDTLIFKGGVSYKGTITNFPSGTFSAPIVFKGNSGWGSGKAIFDLESIRAQAFVSTASYIKIQGFIFTGWTIAGGQFNSVIRPNSSSSRNWTIDSCSFQFMQEWNQYTTWDTYKPVIAIGSTGWTGNKQIYITNNEFVGTGREAILLRAADSVYIQNNNFGGVGRSADSTGWFSTAITMANNGSILQNIWIQDNVFHDGWQYGGDTNPETRHSANWIIAYGNSTKPVRKVTIERNYLYNDKAFSFGTGSGMISASTYTNDFKIRNNVLVNSCAWFGWMLQLGGSSGINDSIWVENNTFVARDYSGTVNSGNSIIVIYPGGVASTNIISNNIFFSDDSVANDWCALRFISTTSSYAGISNYNSFYSANPNTTINWGSFIDYQSSTGLDANSQWNPLSSGIFVSFPSSPINSSTGNYRLNQNASDFLKTGGLNLITHFTDDYAKTTRPPTGGWSIGAYEYVAP